MQGVPLRLEIGPKDLEKDQCVLVRRDNREKAFVSLDELETKIPSCWTLFMTASISGLWRTSTKRLCGP